MDKRIIELLAGCTTNSGASVETLAELTRTLGVALPDDYLSLLSFSNGICGFVGENYLILYSAEDAIPCAIYEDVPYYVFIGSDGGGEGYAYDLRSADMAIVNVPFVGMSSEPARPMGRSVLEFLERLHSRPLFD